MTAPVGPPVKLTGPAQFPPHTALHGRHTSVVPLRPEHWKSLYKHLGGPENLWRWAYLLPSIGFDTAEGAEATVREWASVPPSADRVFYVVLSGPASDPASEPAGMLSYLSIVPEHRRIEIGWVILGDVLKHSREATESFYLFIRHAFRDLGYLRVEWKANHLNTPSLAAARRLGFTYEGIFRVFCSNAKRERKHMIIDGRHRDTAWFSIADDEWPHVEQGFEAWLDDSNFDDEGKQRRALKACRERAAAV